MAIIVAIYSAVLALGIWQEDQNERCLSDRQRQASGL